MSVNIGTLFGTLKLIDEFTPALQKVSKQWNQAATGMFSAGAAITAGVTVPLVGLATHAVKTATEFESAFARVRKSVEGTPQELKKIEQSLLDLAKTIPIPATELAKIAETGGQLGIGKEDILEFTSVIADLAATTTLTGEEAATMMAKFQNIYGRAGKDMGKLASVVSELGNAGASTEADILQMGVRIASAGYQANITQGEVLAIANAIASLGVEAEAGGTSASRFIINMATAVAEGGSQLNNFAKMAGVSAEEFKRAFEKDAASTMLTFFNALQDVKKEGGNIITIMDEMGFHDVRLGNTIRALAGGGDQLTESLKNQKRAWEEGNTHAKRADIIYKTTAAQLQITRNQLNDVSRQLGNELIPLLLQLAQFARDHVIPALKLIVETFAQLPGPMKAMIVAQLAFIAAIGPLLVALGGVAMAVGGITSALPAMAGGLAAVGGSASALALGPLALVLVAITAIGVGLDHLIKKWGDASVAASEAMGKDSQSAGRAFAFVKTQRSGGVISGDQMAQANMDLLDLSRQLNEAKKLEEELLVRGSAAYKDQAIYVKNLTAQFDALSASMARVNADRASAMGGVEGGSSSFVVKGPKKNPVKLDPPMTEEQLKSYNGLMEQLNKQAAGLQKVKAAYDISTAAGEKRARQLEIETAAIGQAQQYQGKYRDQVIAASIAVSKLNDEVEAQGRLSVFKQQATDLDKLDVAYRQGTAAVAKMRQQLELEARVRAAVGKATGKAAKDLEDAATSTFMREQQNAFRDTVGAIRDENDALSKLADQYMAGAISIEQLNEERQLEAEIRQQTMTLSADEAKKLEDEIRARAKLNKSLQQTSEYRNAMTRIRTETSRITAEMSINPRAFRTWESYTAAVRKASEVVRINAEYTENLKRMKEEEAEAVRKAALAHLDAAANADNLSSAISSNYQNPKSIAQWAAGEQAKLAAVYKAGLATQQEYAAGMVEIWKDGAMRALDGIQDVLGSMSRIGGLSNSSTMKAISYGIGQIQAAFDLSKSVTNVASAAGMTAPAASAAGTVAGVFAIFYAVYAGVSDYIKKKKLKQFGNVTEIGIEDGQFGSTELTKFAGKLVNGVKEVVRGIEEALGASIEQMDAISIRARADGKKFEAMVGDMFIGIFDSMEDAVSAATAYAIKTAQFRGLDPIVQLALDKTMADTMEELQSALAAALTASTIQFSGEHQGFLRNINSLDALDSRLIETLGLTFELADALNNTTSAMKDAIENERYRLLGIKRVEDFTKRLTDAMSFNAKIEKERAALLEEINRLTAQMNAAQQQANRPGFSGGLGGSDGSGGSNAPGGPGHGQQLPSQVLEAQYAIQALLDKLAALGDVLSLDEVREGIKRDIIGNMLQYLEGNKKYEKIITAWKQKQLEIEFAQYKLQLQTLDMWDAATQQLWADALAAAKAAAAAGGHGRGGGKKDDVRDFIKNKTFDLATAGFGQFMKALADINKEYDEQLKNAGKDKDLRAKILALKEQELRLLQLQVKQDLIKPFSGGDFNANRSDFTRQMEEINKAYDDARKVYEALGLPLNALNNAERERLELLGLQASSSAGSRTAATILEFRTLGQTMNFLRKNAVELGVDFGTLLKEIQSTQFLAIGDRLMGFVDKYYAGAKGFEQVRLKLEQTRFMLELNNMKLQFQLQKQLGLLTQEQIAMMQGVFDFIDATPVDWDKFFGTGSAVDQLGASASAAGDSIDSLAERFARAKDDLREFLLGLDRGEMGLVSPQDALNAAMRQYQDILTKARGGDINAYEQLDEVGANYIDALKNFSPILAATQLPIIRQELGRMLDMNTIRDGNVTYTERFVQGQTQSNAILSAGFTDLSSHASEQRAISLLSLDELKKIGQQNSDLRADLESLRDAKAAMKQGAA